MRLWSLHPQYLDSRGLVALWREALLAKKVLEGQTKGYKNHPQLIRFKQHPDPLKAINHYLKVIFKQSQKLGFNFDHSKFCFDGSQVLQIQVNQGQVNYELSHLLKKLSKRDQKKHQQLIKIKDPIVHPLFVVVEGEVEDWEKV